LEQGIIETVTAELVEGPLHTASCYGYTN